MTPRHVVAGDTAGGDLGGTYPNPTVDDDAIDHGTTGGLTDDDHTQYALLLGRSGGQTLIGGTAASNNLTLTSTSNATKGEVQSTSPIRVTGGGFTELLADGNFTSGTGWTFGSGWSYDATNDEGDHASDGTGTLSNSATITIGRVYTLSFEVKNRTVGNVTPSCGGVTMNLRNANGTYYHTFIATSTAALTFTPSNTARLSIDTVSLKESTGGDLFATGSVQVGGVLALPTTTSAIGQILQANLPVFHTYGAANLFIGLQSGNFTTSGTGFNIGLGQYTLGGLTTGVSNLAIGSNALGAGVVTGSGNNAMGVSAGTYLSSGSNNTFIGGNTGALSATQRLTTASGTVYIGASASPNSDGSQYDNVVAIGQSTVIGATGAVAIGSAASATHTNSMAIGISAATTAIDQIVLGKTSTPPNVYIPGKLGVGTTPTANLDILGDVNSSIYSQVKNANAGASADTRLIIVGDTGSFQFVLNSSTNTTLAGANSTNFYTIGGDMGFYTGFAERFRVTNGGLTGFGITPSGNALLQVKAGTGTGIAKIGGNLTYSTTATGNVGTGEDNLISYTVPANTMPQNGDYLEFEAAGTITNTADAKRIRVKFGATTIFDTGAAGIPVSAAIDWIIEGKIIRTGAATQKCYVAMNTNNATFPSYADYTTGAETLSGTVVLKLTGEATSDNDIVEEMFTVEWRPAN